jgi:hypothetical protein
MSIFESNYLDTTECISIVCNNQSYTDCMEFSLLRFAHLLMADPIEIKLYDKSKWMISNEQNPSDEMKQFMEKYPFIYNDAKYYLNTNEAKEMRNEWSYLVSGKEYFEYYRDDQMELFTNIHNIKQFLTHVLGYPNPDKIFESLQSDIKTTHSKEDYTISEAIKWMSKDVSKYNEYNKKKYYIVHDNCDRIKFKIKYDDNMSEEYLWQLRQIYFDSKYQIYNPFITGHSVIRPLNKYNN